MAGSRTKVDAFRQRISLADLLQPLHPNVSHGQGQARGPAGHEHAGAESAFQPDLSVAARGRSVLDAGVARNVSRRCAVQRTSSVPRLAHPEPVADGEANLLLGNNEACRDARESVPLDVE